MTTRQARGVPAFVLLLLLTACSPFGGTSTPGATVGGGGPTAAPSVSGEPTGGVATAADACAMVTTAEMSEVTGQAVQAAVAGTGSNTGACAYTLADRTPVVLTTYLTGPSVASIFEAYKQTESAEPVEGVGDEAVWGFGTLFVRKGDKLINISPVGVGDNEAARLELARLIAERALPRMQ
jgi:hypothetical protein